MPLTYLRRKRVLAGAFAAPLAPLQYPTDYDMELFVMSSSFNHIKRYLVTDTEFTLQESLPPFATSYGGSAYQGPSNGLTISADGNTVASVARYWSLYRSEYFQMNMFKRDANGNWTQGINTVGGAMMYPQFSKFVNDKILVGDAGTYDHWGRVLNYDYSTNTTTQQQHLTRGSNSAGERYAFAESNGGNLVALYSQNGWLRIFAVTSFAPYTLELRGTAPVEAVRSHMTHRRPQWNHDNTIIATQNHPSFNTYGQPVLVINHPNNESGDFSQNFTYTLNTGVTVVKEGVRWLPGTNILAVHVAGGNIRYYNIAVNGTTVTPTLIHTASAGISHTIESWTPDMKYLFARDAQQIPPNGIMRVYKMQANGFDYEQINELEVGKTISHPNGGLGYSAVRLLAK